MKSSETVNGGGMVELATGRLLLRRWQEADRAPFARMNADLRVMEFMPQPLTPAQSDALVDRIHAHFRRQGFGLFAVELRDEQCFIGYVGLAVPAFEASFTPCVEIGWRLAFDYWGRGLATEAAREVARYAFGELALPELVSFTAAGNWRSRRVMEKLGMTHDAAGDFDHPKLPQGHPLQRHVLYRLRAALNA